MPLAHEQIKRLIGPYVVKELPAQVIPTIHDHLEGCLECQSEATAIANLVTELTSDDLVTPPRGFALRVIDRARAHDSSRRRGIGLAATAILSLLGLFTWSFLQTQDVQNRLDRQREALETVIGAGEGFALQGNESHRAARVMIGADGPVLVAVGLPRLAEGRVYQLWLTSDASTVSAGLFRVSDDVSVVAISRPIEGFDRALITIEPEGGSKRPTGEPIVISHT